MPAPVVAAVGAHLGHNLYTSLAIAVPSGMANGQVAVCVLFTEQMGTITAPAGFTLIGDAVNTSVTKNHRVMTYWKRATGADSGTYEFTYTVPAWGNAVAVRVTGVISSGDPIDAVGTSATTTDATSPPTITLTTVSADTLLLYAAGGWANETAVFWTPPTGYIENADIDGTCFCVDSLDKANTGSTGAITAVTTVTQPQSAVFSALRSNAAPSPDQTPGPPWVNAGRSGIAA